MGLPLLHGKLLRKVALGVWFFSHHQRVIFMQQLEVPSKKTERDGASKTCDDMHATCCQTDDREGARDGRGTFYTKIFVIGSIFLRLCVDNTYFFFKVKKVVLHEQSFTGLGRG